MVDDTLWLNTDETMVIVENKDTPPLRKLIVCDVCPCPPYYLQGYYLKGGNHSCNCALFDIHMVIDGTDIRMGRINLNNGGSDFGGSRYGNGYLNPYDPAAWWRLAIPPNSSVQVYQVCMSPYRCYGSSDCHASVTTFRVCNNITAPLSCLFQGLVLGGSNTHGVPGTSTDISSYFVTPP
jgi:hypothetical protein